MPTMEQVKKYLDDRKEKELETKLGDVMKHFNIGEDEAKKIVRALGVRIVRERIPYMIGPNPKKIYWE